MSNFKETQLQSMKRAWRELGTAATAVDNAISCTPTGDIRSNLTMIHIYIMHSKEALEQEIADREKEVGN